MGTGTNAEHKITDVIASFSGGMVEDGEQDWLLGLFVYFFFKKYITEKMKSENLNIARIDLVFDNKKMIDLLEARGNSLKV